MSFNKWIVGFILLSIVILIFFVFYYYNAHQTLTLASLKENALSLRKYVNKNYISSVVGYIFIYIVISMLPLPGDTLFNIAGGYLFGAVAATFYINFSMTVAAIIMFLVVRYFGKNLFSNSTARPILWIRKQIAKNGFSYFLTLRLIPLIPISFVNIAAGLSQVPLYTFIWTTAIGLLPISFILAYSGQELRTIHHINDIFSIHIIALLIILGFITLSPIFFNLTFKKKST